jgi:hypothetical protein
LPGLASINRVVLRTHWRADLSGRGLGKDPITMKSFFTTFLLMFGVVGLYRAIGHAHCPLAQRAHGHPPAALAAPGETGRWAQDNVFDDEGEDDRDRDRDRDRRERERTRRESRRFRPWDLAGEREPADGLPVPIYPGTRVTEAEVRPPLPPSPPALPVKLGRERAAAGIVAVEGRISANEPRAEADARVQLDHRVRDWLAPEVPASWRPPARMIDRLVVGKQIRPVVKPYGTLYVATLEADLSPPRRQPIVAVYHRQLVAHRLTVLGGVLGFVLACLAAVAGYIRTDEATKGYYTGWLRAAAAAGVGAAGVLIYQVIT